MHTEFGTEEAISDNWKPVSSIRCYDSWSSSSPIDNKYLDLHL